jgi:hypothetical protein
MTTTQTTAGTKLYIGSAIPQEAMDQTAYEGITYTELGKLETLGEFGETFNEITFNDMSSRRVEKLKGNKNAGNLSVQVAFKKQDAGQVALAAALQSDDDYAFKVEFNDAGTGSPSSPTTLYFYGKVMSRTINVSNSEDVIRVNSTLAINSEILEVAAV